MSDDQRRWAIRFAPERGEVTRQRKRFVIIVAGSAVIPPSRASASHHLSMKYALCAGSILPAGARSINPAMRTFYWSLQTHDGAIGGQDMRTYPYDEPYAEPDMLKALVTPY